MELIFVPLLATLITTTWTIRDFTLSSSFRTDLSLSMYLSMCWGYVSRSIHAFQIITARVRTYDGRLCFHRCVSVRGGGGGGVPGLSKGKTFWHQIWLDTCSDWEKNFCQGTPPPSIARNCYGYTAGDMRLAFTQEDFLVFCVIFQVKAGDTVFFIEWAIYVVLVKNRPQRLQLQSNPITNPVT